MKKKNKKNKKLVMFDNDKKESLECNKKNTKI